MYFTLTPIYFFIFQEVFNYGRHQTGSAQPAVQPGLFFTGNPGSEYGPGASPAPETPATVYGVVSDGTTPIPNATVKLFDSTGMPYKHAITDETGAYTLSDVPAGTYSLAAVADGYRLSDAAGVTLTNGIDMQMNLVCVQDTTLSLGAIAGVLTVNNQLGVPVPLGGGKITLKDALGTTIATTYTAADGEFTFYDLADGVYTLISSADGYMPSSSMTAIVSNGSLTNLTFSMVADLRTYNGTVSGIISNTAGQAVAGCFVGLYQVTHIGDVTQEKLVAVTKTNAAGKYLFGNVSGGSYKIKAKL